MAFLDPVDGTRRDHQAMVHQPVRLHPPAVAASETDGDDADLTGPGEGGEQVFRIAAGRKADQGIAPPRLGREGTGEDMGEADIVADRRHLGEIGPRLTAASAGRPAVTGCRNSTVTCAASQDEPPLPIAKRRPPSR